MRENKSAVAYILNLGLSVAWLFAPISLALVGCGGQLKSANSETAQSFLPITQTLDADGYVWTLIGGQIYRNGVVDPATGGVTLLVFANGSIYQETNLDGSTWYQLTTTNWPAGAGGWQLVSDPQ